MNSRIDIKALLANPESRKKLMVGAILALQHREGVDTTKEQAEKAYEKVQKEHRGSHVPLTPQTAHRR